MPISMKCECGHEFSVVPSLAGQTVACSACGRPLTVPDQAQSPGDLSSTVPPLQDRTGPSNEGEPQASPGRASETRDRAETGSPYTTGSAAQPPVERGDTCPKCGVPIDNNAVLCVRCGYNRKMGRRMTSAAESAMLANAEEQIALEEAQERERNRSGLPWQFHAISLAALVFFCMILPCLPPALLLLLGFVLVMFVGLPLLVLGACEASLGVERFRVLQTLRSALATLYRSLQPKSEGTGAGLHPDHLGAGRIIMLAILLGFLGMCMSCCGIRGCSSATGNASRVNAIAIQLDMPT